MDRYSNKDRTMRITLVSLTLVAMLAAPMALAKDKKGKQEAPEAFKQVIACRQITDEKARLACYDTQVAALDTAQQAGEVVVADKKQVEEAERGLFGFSIPKSPLTGSEAKPIEQIETVVSSARQYEYGKWRLTMEDGSVWEQVDGAETLAFDPRNGDKVTIKRAAFGSYKARIGGQPGIRVRRVQ